jgi:hypothetical protein
MEIAHLPSKTGRCYEDRVALPDAFVTTQIEQQSV